MPGDSMQYIIKCWHCMAEFDVLPAPWCSHSNPTKTCPFCLKCFCDASNEYKKDFLQNSPPQFVAELISPPTQLYLKIGEVLVKAGKITEDQLQKALGKQRILKKKLGEILMMMSLVTPDELQLYLLNQKSLEEIDLKNVDVDFSLVQRIGKDSCLDFKIIPIEIQEVKDGEVLRFAFYSLENLNRLKRKSEFKRYKLIPYMAKKEDIQAILNNLEVGEKEIKIYTSKESIDAVEMLNQLIRSAILYSASNIFFEFKSGQLNVLLQMDEGLRKVNIPDGISGEFFEKVKQIAGIKRTNIDIVQKSDLNLSKDFNQYRIRIFYFPGANQENIRFKIINVKNLSKTIKELNLAHDEMETIEAELKKHTGLYMIVGPNSNRLHEVLYSFMHSLPHERIASVESQVLLRNQRFFQIEIEEQEVNENVYKNLLFFKPSSMFLFDYFEKNFRKKFFDFSKDGKLFLGINAFSYEEIFDKMRTELEVPLSYFIENLRLLIFQKMVRILCPHCKQIDPRPINELFRNIVLSKSYSVFREKGCEECNFSGYKKSEICYEVFVLSDHERVLFRESDFAQMNQKISEIGNLTISQKVMSKVLKGEVSYQEYSRFF